MAQHSVNEQLMLELVNRARLDPLSEAKRLGIDLNRSLPAGTLNGLAKAVLAPNDLLVDAARAHSQHMLDVDMFAHQGIDDGTPSSRVLATGYSFNTLGENIAINGTSQTANLTALTIANHDGLFRSAPHRLNILSDNFREIGIGIKQGKFLFDNFASPLNSVDATQNFARSGSDVFITGVAITDANRNNFYDIGEQRAGIVISAQQSAVTVDSDTTGTAGGYGIGLAAGAYQVQFHGGGLSQAVNCSVNVLANVKLDLAGSNEILSSASIVLGDGAVATSLLGVANLNATGNAVGNVLLGNRGANSLAGLDGNDKLLGGAGADRLQGGDGVDVLTGGAGRDQLTGGAQRDIFDFNTLTESGATSATRDLIRDFSRGLDDIDLSTLDAITGGGNNAFTFIGKSAFSQVAGQLRYVLFNQAGSTLDHTIVEGDVNGDARADFQIDLSGLIGFTTTDFIL